MAQEKTRPAFESDGESLGPDEMTPTNASTALARFEFEFGKGNEGTKILMVEWEDDEETSGDWEVSWEGKTTSLSAKDGAESKEKDGRKPTHRLYFLLAPGAMVPPRIKIKKSIRKDSNEGGETVLYANSLPAIFPRELGLSGREEGKKGVLHTIWAKKRLGVLKEEIDRESRNTEGIGLDMAIREREWIIENFGVDGNSTTSPKTPSGGRLAEKLRGLKLGVSIAELNARTADNVPANIEKESAHPLSPATGDVVFSSFALFHDDAASRSAKAPQPKLLSQQIAASRNSSRMSSLDAITSGDIVNPVTEEDEDDLFAVKMSPRSPEMVKSPFSFTDPNGETLSWGK